MDLKNVSEEKNKMSKYIRELEQKNDDLERTERMIMESVAVKESLLNNAIEKNALLELEIDEKESLQEKLQRLMDETNGKCLVDFDCVYRPDTSRFRKFLKYL